MSQSDEEKGFLAQLFNGVLNLCCGCCLTEDAPDESNRFSRTNSRSESAQIISREVLPHRASLRQDPRIREINAATTSRALRPISFVAAETNNQNESLVLPSRNRRRVDQNFFDQSSRERLQFRQATTIGSNQINFDYTNFQKEVANRELLLSIPQIEALDKRNAVSTVPADENDSFEANRHTEPSANRQGEVLRQVAKQHFNQFKILQNKAKLANRTNNKLLSRNYFVQANRQKQLFDKANAEAAATFLEENLPQATNPNTIDLHHLYVKEAITALDLFIDRHINVLRTQQKKITSLTIITGRGKHSSEGPKIKPAVIKRLNERDLRYTFSNPGCLKVLVLNQTLLLHEL